MIMMIFIKKESVCVSMIAKLFKWVSFAYEGFLAIPIIGGLFIFANSWTPLLYAFVLHLVTFLLCKKYKLPGAGNIVGIIASILGAIPIIGWLLHCVTSIILLIEAVASLRRQVYRY